MRLSLSILADWLQKYSPVCSIASGERTIRNVRMFSDGHRFTDNNVYISRTGGDSGWVICMHKNDYILLNTEDESQVMNEIMDAFDHYNDWSDSLNRNLKELTLQQILDASSNVLGATLMLADASYYILAHAKSDLDPLDDDAYQSVQTHGIMDMGHILNIERDAKIREHRRHAYIQDTGGFTVDPSVRNLFTGGSHWGWLISVSHAQTRGKMDIQDELGDILELWMQNDQEQQSQWELSGVFLSILDGSYPSRESANFQLRLMGWQTQEEKRVYTLTNPEKSLALIHKVEQLSSGVRALIYEDRLIAVFHGSALERQRFQELLTRLLTQSGCRCGVSPGFWDIFTLKEQYALSRAASEYGAGTLCPFEDWAVDHALEIIRVQCGTWLPHPALERLRAYDRENHTEFHETFRQYLIWERSIARTARAMGLHRNTLLYRIARIQEITELDLEDPKLRFHLLMSVLLNVEKADYNGLWSKFQFTEV